MRTLEGEIRELKELLDEKDEKIDILSKINSFSPGRRPSVVSASPGASASAPSPSTAKEDTFSIQQAPFLQESERKSDPFFSGSSSSRAFVGRYPDVVVRLLKLTPQILSNPNSRNAANQFRTSPQKLSLALLH